MQITSCASPSFSGIKVQTSKMNWLQRGISDKLCRSIEYCDKYAELTRKGADIDIYMFPARKGVEVRLIDLYSEKFIKSKGGKIFKMFINEYGSFEEAADKVLEKYENVVKGIIKRPVGSLKDYIQGKTDVARINPKARDNVKESIEMLTDGGAFSREQAEKYLYEEHMDHVKEFSIDAEF